MKTLRALIRKILEEERKDKLLTEPDETEGREEEEVSAGGVAGVSTPLGTGPNYPSKSARKKIKSPLESIASSFGNAKPVKKK